MQDPVVEDAAADASTGGGSSRGSDSGGSAAAAFLATSPVSPTSAAAATSPGASLALTLPTAAATSLAASQALPTSAAAATSSGAPPPPPVKVFNMDHANSLMKAEDWDEVEAYARSILSDSKEDNVEDFARLHPGLYLFFREEKLLQLLAANKNDEAQVFYQQSIVPLEDSTGLFKPVDIGVRIKNLDPSNSPDPIRRSVHGEVSSYLKLYFPKSVGREEYANSCEQFVEKYQQQKSPSGKYCMVCLACGWNVSGLWKMRPHFIYSESDHVKSHVKCCSRVTQDLLNRLKKLDGKPIPDFSELVTKFETSRASSTSSRYSSASEKSKREKSDIVASGLGLKRSRVKRSEEKLMAFDDLVSEKADLIHVFCIDLANLMKMYVPVEFHGSFQKKVIDIESVGVSLRGYLKHDMLKDALGSGGENLPFDDFGELLIKKLNELHELCIDLGKLTKAYVRKDGLVQFGEKILQMESEVGFTLRFARLKKAIRGL